MGAILRVLMFLIVMDLYSCDGRLNIGNSRNERGQLSKILGSELGQGALLSGESLKSAGQTCKALAQQKEEIRPGLIYNFELTQKPCQQLPLSPIGLQTTLEEEGAGWFWRMPVGNTIKYFNQMPFHDQKPFSGICGALARARLGEGAPNDTVVEGLQAQKFSFGKREGDILEVQMATAFKEAGAAQFTVHKIDVFRIYLGGVGARAGTIPVGTVLFRNQESLCKVEDGGKVDRESLGQVLKSIQ